LGLGAKAAIPIFGGRAVAFGPTCGKARETDIEARAQEDRPYLAFGLRIRSAVPLPELPVSDDARGEADVTIAVGRLDDRLAGAVEVDAQIQVAGDEVRLSTPAGRYAIRGGRLIVVDARSGAAPADVRLYLLGAAMGALCHQRGVLPLHATAVWANGRAIGVAGPSGAGKSTLAVQFLQRGLPVLADDLCVVHPGDSGAAWAMPGTAHIKLWSDSLSLAGLKAATLPRVAEGIEKFSLPVARADPLEPRRLGELYVLRPGADRVSIRRLQGPEAVSAVLANVYRWPMAVAMGQAPARFDQCIALVGCCPIFELCVLHDWREPNQIFQAIEHHLHV
jgi:hypothetical protein